jgi:hypothetical protein
MDESLLLQEATVMKRFGIVLIIALFGLVLACGQEEKPAPKPAAPPAAEKGAPPAAPKPAAPEHPKAEPAKPEHPAPAPGKPDHPK